MSSHPLPNPGRLRQIPPRFSWIDHRLVRERYFERCSCDAPIKGVRVIDFVLLYLSGEHAFF